MSEAPGTGESLDQELPCTDVTGLDCDFVARPDSSAEWAKRGSVADQLMAQMTTHIGKEHRGHTLSPDRIDEVRTMLEQPPTHGQTAEEHGADVRISPTVR